MGDTIFGDKYGGDRVHGNKVVYTGNGAAAASPAAQPKAATILLMSANPIGTAPLRLDDERRSIDLAVAPAGTRLVLRTADAVRLNDLQAALLRHKPTIVHFSGHATAREGIVVTDDDGAPQFVPPHALSDLFRILSGSVRCVVLNACFTEAQGNAIAKHVPAVVGMHHRVRDDSAILFARSFYAGIASGMSIRVSFELGHNMLLMHRQPDDDVPVLIGAGLEVDMPIIPD